MDAESTCSWPQPRLSADLWIINLNNQWNFSWYEVLKPRSTEEASYHLVSGFYFILNFYLLIWERERGGRREKHWCVVPLIHVFIGCFLYVLWPGIKPTILSCWDDALTNCAIWPRPQYIDFVSWRGNTLWLALVATERPDRNCSFGALSLTRAGFLSPGRDPQP